MAGHAANRSIGAQPRIEEQPMAEIGGTRIIGIFIAGIGR
jgi:hypothetical protein